MKTIRYLLILFFSVLSINAYSSHAVGLRITYQYISGNDYMFNLKFYRDCSGISAPTTASICFSSASGSIATFSAQLQMDTANSGFEVPFNSCNGTGPTFCSGGNIFAFEEYNYKGVVNVPPLSDWVVSYSLCCRNAAITNLVNPDMYSAYVETRFDNLNFPGNSSPEFNAVPVNYYCAGIPSIVDYSAYDIDGDSLSYEFTSIFDGSCGIPDPINYAPPFTPTQPLATLVPTTFDPVNGMISFTPSAIQIAVIGFKVNEYRNGVLIGSVRRDDEVVVVGGFTNPDTILGRVYYDLNMNSIFDAPDIPAGNMIVHLGPGNSYTASGGNGKFEFLTSPGVYDLTLPNLPLYTTVTPSNIIVNAPLSGTSYPNNDFILQPVSNQNDLEITINKVVNPTPGMQYPLVVNYHNSGTTVQNNVDIVVTLDPLLQYVSATPTPTNVTGNTLTWNFASMNMFATGSISVLTGVDTTAAMGAPVICTAIISSSVTDLTPGNNTDILNDIIAAPFDPNSKHNFPEGDISLAFVQAQDWINYKIYFQNLGTAPAQTVRILDLIDIDLDLASLELVSSSRPCAVLLTSPNQLEFKFFGINLPAASVNEAGSHGYVEYRIKPKSSLNAGSLITNNASILFDFSPPIYTNLVHNKVVLITSLNELNISDQTLKVFPSPATDIIHIEIDIDVPNANLELNVYDILGASVLNKTVSVLPGVTNVSLPVNELTTGVYILKMHNNKKQHVAKFSVVHN